MKKPVEMINFSNNPGKVLNSQINSKVDNPFFSIYTIYDGSTINIETINSILNQTYQDFEWVIFGNKQNVEVIKKFIKDNDITDTRITFKVNKNDVKGSCKSNYLIPIDFETYLDRTILEIFYSYINYYKNADILYTNVISRKDQKCLNDSLISLTKRTINFSCKSFCFHKKVFDYIRINENGMYKIDGNFNFIHFDFYGVWHELSQENVLKLKYGSFKNFPSSSTYNFDTIPDEVPLKLGYVPKGKNILCMVPWHKIGGADLFNYNIFKYLKNKGYNIYLISTEVCHYEARAMMENVVDAFYDLTTFLDRKEWANFIKSLIISKNIDLILELSSLYGYYLIPWLKYQFPKIPIIDYIHVENFAWRNGGFPRDSVAVSNYLDKTYCCNKHLENLLYEEMGRTVHNTQTLYIGVDTDKYNPDIVEITDEEIKEFCQNKKVILYPCRFCFEKRPIFLLKVMKKLAKKRDDIVCLMVGDGEAKSAVEQYIKSNELESIVKIVPLKNDIRQYYKLANITFICSLFEGITLTTYESLSMNTPVISSDVGGQKEVVNDKVGVVIKRFQDSKELMDFNYSDEELKLYEDSVLKVLNNEDKYIKNNNCRNYMIKNYSIKKIYNDFEKEIAYYLKKGSSIDEKILNNPMNAAQYLVLFNETSRVYYNNSIDYENFKSAMRDRVYRNNKLWSHWWYRTSVNVAKKLKIDKMIKKIIFKNK